MQKRILIKTLGSLFLAYALLLGTLTVFQHKLIYPVLRTQAPMLAAQGLTGFQEITYATTDNLSLTGWYAPPRGNSFPTYIIFHGNAGDLSQRAPFAAFLQAQGNGVLLTSYRGYPPNGGSPSEQALYDDAQAARAYVNAQSVHDDRLIIMGMSLGSGPATWLAAQMAESSSPARGLVLEVPFTSLPAAAQHHYWYVPVSLLLREDFDNLTRSKNLKGTPLLVLAAENDHVVPPAQAKALFEAGDSRFKQFKLIAEASHTDILDDHTNFHLVTDWAGRITP